MTDRINDFSGKPNIDPLAARRIREKLGLPEPVVNATDSNEILHVEQLNDFQRLLQTTNEDDFIKAANSIDPKAIDIQGMTVGHHAARLGYIKAYLNFRDVYNPKNLVVLELNNLKDNRGNTPLDCAILADHIQMVNAIKESDKGLVYSGHTNFSKAIETCFKTKPVKVDIVKIILDGSSKDSPYRKALNLAISNEGNEELIEWLISKWPNRTSSTSYSCYEGTDKNTQHPINAAISLRNNLALEKLLELGVGSDRTTNPYPIELAIKLSNHEALRLLLKYRITEASPGPLEQAFIHRNFQAFEILVKEGNYSDFDSKKVSGQGYFHRAIGNNLPEFAQILISLKADPYQLSDSGRITPLGKISNVFPMEQRYSFFRMFAEAGIDISGPAVITSKGRKISTAEKLLDLDDPDGLALIKELGVNLDTVYDKRENLLHQAVRKKKLASFIKLVELGVNLNLCNQDGKTPIDLVENTLEYQSFRDYLRTLVE